MTKQPGLSQDTYFSESCRKKIEIHVALTQCSKFWAEMLKLWLHFFLCLQYFRINSILELTFIDGHVHLSGVDWNIFTFTTCSVLETLAGFSVSPHFFSLITNLVTLRKLAEWFQSYFSHRSHNIVTALQNLIERLSLCTFSTVECSLIFYSILSHTLSVFIKWRKTLTTHQETCLRIFYICCPISLDRL